MLLEVPLDRVDAVERAVDDETQGLVVLAEVGSSGFFSAPMASAATKLTLLWRPRSIAIVESTLSVTTNAQSSGARTYCAASKVSAALASAGRRAKNVDVGSIGTTGAMAVHRIRRQRRPPIQACPNVTRALPPLVWSARGSGYRTNYIT